MPTYSYACTACDHRFDAQQAFTDDALTQCPHCAGRLRKLFGNVGVVFKGSGFYRTDARADNKGAKVAAGAKSSSGGASSSSSSSSSSAGSSASGSSDSSGSSSSGSSATGSGSSGSGSSGSGSSGSGSSSSASTAGSSAG